MPRGRQGTFNPQIVEKHQIRWTGGFDDKILSLYASGMTVRDPGALQEIYGAEVSPSLI
ncbi:hypothetical protein PSEUDO9AZ_40207 [Pseudomonas sp. 9AZ]|nr:hypothetical protein PSEUDO9AZ_40207 [Pseudomonas sp. 9AZ]